MHIHTVYARAVHTQAMYVNVMSVHTVHAHAVHEAQEVVKAKLLLGQKKTVFSTCPMYTSPTWRRYYRVTFVWTALTQNFTLLNVTS